MTNTLDEYQRKRDFRRTPEPTGQAASGGGSIFVVQKHAASHLHYDFRLQMHGALKSWAVPKGPSLNPAEHRLAQETEDHPLEYAGFEGIIPAGQYGAGTVMVWDTGIWEPLGQGKQGYYHGQLDFALYGTRLKGHWSLVRQEGERRRWHLLKLPDQYSSADDILRLNTSVLSGRSMEEIAADHDAVWTREGRAVEARPLFGHTSGGMLPERMEPQLATLADRVPEGDEWLHEIKYDGYRVLCRIDRQGSGVRFFTRNGNDLSERVEELGQAVARLAVDRAWLDGEIVVLNEAGRSDFHALQNALDGSAPAVICYLVFDLIYYEGYPLLGVPLQERKALLRELIPEMDLVRYVDQVRGDGPAFYQAACAADLEGVVSKGIDSVYVPGRGRRWLKVKCARREWFVIGGYTESGAGRPFGSLLAGRTDAQGNLRFVGKIRSGYSSQESRDLLGQLRSYEQPASPFVNPPSGVEFRNPHWLRPELLAEVQYTEMTPETGLLRHASFKGLGRAPLAPAPKPKPTRAPVGRPQPVFPHERIDRQAVLAYYTAAAPYMLPFLRDRPLTLIVCPTNIYACKFTKHATKFTAPVKAIDAGHAEKYIAVDSVEGILALVEQGTVEIHGWQSRVAKLEFPDRLVIDLDPQEGEPREWERLAEAALLVRLHLQQHGLQTFVQTTGGKGYYVVAPLAAEQAWQVVTPFARRVAEELEQLYPDRFTARMAKNERHGKIFLDWVRNGRGANSAEPYSLRARPGAPVSVPISWEELAAGTRPDSFSLVNMTARLATVGQDSPWQNYFQIAQGVPERDL